MKIKKYEDKLEARRKKRTQKIRERVSPTLGELVRAQVEEDEKKRLEDLVEREKWHRKFRF